MTRMMLRPRAAATLSSTRAPHASWRRGSQSARSSSWQQKAPANPVRGVLLRDEASRGAEARGAEGAYCSRLLRSFREAP